MAQIILDTIISAPSLPIRKTRLWRLLSSAWRLKLGLYKKLIAKKYYIKILGLLANSLMSCRKLKISRLFKIRISIILIKLALL